MGDHSHRVMRCDLHTLAFVREQHIKQQCAAYYAMAGIKPKDEAEGMIAALLVASYNASMDCYRRAAIDNQTPQARQENLNQANKLSRTFSTLLEGLNRHRGKGQQKVTVEHVHVHEGGQAIVGNVETQGGGLLPKPEDQAHAKQIAHALTPLPSPDTARHGTPVASDAERPMPDARRDVTGPHRRGIKMLGSMVAIVRRRSRAAGQSRS
jgi:hypothetical protein